MRGIAGRLRQRAKQLRGDTYALYLAYQDDRVPWYAKAFAVCVVAYAFCPLDLIPDFVPILGQLDDLILVPLGITLALKMIPPEVLAESRLKARELLEEDRPKSWAAASIIIAVWLLLAALALLLLIRTVRA